MADDLVEGAAPFSASNGTCGVLLLHGFTGSPAELRALAEAFADAGFSVELPLLPGHGTRAEELMGCGFDDFASAADAAYLALAARCDRTVVLGLSMGGTLACWLAARYRDLAGLVLINPLVAPPAPSALALLRAALGGGADALPAIGRDVARPGVASAAYDKTPIATLISVLEATTGVADALESICCPVLLLSSRVDHVVDPGSSDVVERRVAGPVERVVLDKSYHVATLDYDAEEIEHRAVTFALKVAC